MSAYNDVSKKYSIKQLEKFVYDSVVPGWCKICKKATMRVETDAENYTCKVCKTENAVSSVLIILSLI